MSKEVLGGERPSPAKASATPVNGTTNSLADIIPTTTYRGRGRRPGVGRGRRNLSTMLIPPTQGAPQAETAQIMLSLSGNTTGPTLQTTSRNVRISPNSRMGRTLQTGSNILDSSKLLRNGALSTTDLKALREQLNLEPRKRGRRRQTFGFGRGRIKDVVDSKFGIQSIKKEMDDIQQKDGIHFKPLESKVNLFNNNGNNDAKSPLLASLLSKAEALAKAKVKTENDAEDGQTTEQETVLYQFDGESSGATKYLDALKEAGLPTDVPVLIDNGDGNYVTLTEDVLMNVLGNNEEFQFQVTEATLEQGDVSEGVVLQDGTIMMTGKNGKSDLTGPLLTVGKKPIAIKNVKEVKGKRGPKPKQLVVRDLQPAKLAENNATSPNSTKKEPENKKSVQELINEAVLESLKNGAANEAEDDPDAVVLFEVTDNAKVCKYVVSSKEVSALKALNEQIERQKKQNSPGEKKSPLPTVIDGNTNIAEIKLTVCKNSRKSIVSEVLARAHSLENQVKNGILNELTQSNNGIKKEANSPQMLDINMATDVLNDSSQLMGISPAREHLENPNMMDLSEESQMLDEDNSMVVLNDESEMMQIDGQHEEMNISGNENLIVVNNSEQILQQEGVDLAVEPSEDSQLMQINESSQEGGETEETADIINVEDADGTVPPSGRDMPLLESESQLVELEFIDGNGEKIEGYRVEGTVLSQKEISAFSGLSNQGKDSDVIGLLDMVCEEAAAQEDISKQVLNDVSTIKQNVPCSDSIKVNVTSIDNSIQIQCQNTEYSVAEATKAFTSSSEHLVLEEVQNIDASHLESAEMLDEGECHTRHLESAEMLDEGECHTRHLESAEMLDEGECHTSHLESAEMLDEGECHTRHLESAEMLDEGECHTRHLESAEMLDEGECHTRHLESAEMLDEEECHTSELESAEMLDEEECHTSHLESGEMLDEGECHTSHLESGEMLDEGECRELSVEQALQAMMGDENSAEVESQEFNEEIKPSKNLTQDSTLQQLTHGSESTRNLDNPNTFEFVYGADEDAPTEDINVMQTQREKHLLHEESTNKILTDLTIVKPEEVMNEECIETSVVSPTKDVPFAVGLVPLKDALVQIQSIPDHQPRKTRSGSINKSETVGTKRRSSEENSTNGPVKRRKSVEGDNASNQIVDDECVITTT